MLSWMILLLSDTTACAAFKFLFDFGPHRAAIFHALECRFHSDGPRQPGAKLVRIIMKNTCSHRSITLTNNFEAFWFFISYRYLWHERTTCADDYGDLMLTSPDALSFNAVISFDMVAEWVCLVEEKQPRAAVGLLPPRTMILNTHHARQSSGAEGFDIKAAARPANEMNICSLYGMPVAWVDARATTFNDAANISLR